MMSNPSLRDEGSINHARTACEPCKKSKRRCDRVLPSCELCVRKDVECLYLRKRRPQDNVKNISDNERRGLPMTAANSMPIDRNSTRSSTSTGTSFNSTPSGSSSAPGISIVQGTSDAAAAIYFIAPDIFHQARLELPQPQLSIPPSLIHCSLDAANVRKISSKFFETIHWWMPIVSKKGFFAQLLNPLQQRRAELMLLITAMRLICSEADKPVPGDDAARIELYKQTKRMYFEMETCGILSLRVLQAGVLIALYETGHAIYPAAYLSVGACVRYGVALGIDKLVLEPDDAHERVRMYSEMEIEEQRRVWWSLLLLDRFMCLASPERTPSTKSPSFNALLPVDDQNFDNGNIKPGDPFSISAGFNLKMGMFSRLAQATYLLSQAIELLATCPSDDVCPDHGQQIAQLRRTIHALVNVSGVEATLLELEMHPGICPQLSLCYSTIFLLQERHWKKMVSERASKTPPFDETLASLDRMFAAALYIQSQPGEFNLELMATPLLAHVVYHAACFLIRLCNGSPDEQVKGKIQLFKWLLEEAAKRWRVAAVYLSILEAQEMAVASESACKFPPAYSEERDVSMPK